MLPATSWTSNPALAQLVGGGGELLGAAGGERQRVALLAEHLGDGEADPARGSGDDRGAVGHRPEPTLRRVTRAPLTIMAVLAALLMGAVVADGRARGVAAGAASRSAPVDVIAKRVEALRGLRFESLPRPVEVTPGAGAARGAGGPRPLLPRGAPARRRAGAEAARADRRLGRPARRVRLGVLRGRRGLLRPAHEADAHRARRGHGHAGAGGDGARARAHARARGPALRARPRGPGRQRRRGAGAARAGRGHRLRR